MATVSNSLWRPVDQYPSIDNLPGMFVFWNEINNTLSLIHMITDARAFDDAREGENYTHWFKLPPRPIADKIVTAGARFVSEPYLMDEDEGIVHLVLIRSNSQTLVAFSCTEHGKINSYNRWNDINFEGKTTTEALRTLNSSSRTFKVE